MNSETIEKITKPVIGPEAVQDHPESWFARALYWVRHSWLGKSPEEDHDYTNGDLAEGAALIGPALSPSDYCGVALNMGAECRSQHGTQSAQP